MKVWLIESETCQHGSTVLWDQTSMRMSQHGAVIIPALLTYFKYVVVVTTDAGQTEFEKIQHKFAQIEVLNKIPWSEIKAVIHTADPAFMSLQIGIEAKSKSLKIPIFRLEDKIGGAFMNDITTGMEFNLLADYYFVVNQASQEFALKQGIPEDKIFIIGVPDFSMPDNSQVGKIPALRAAWKEKLGFGNQFVIVYTTSGYPDVDLQVLPMVMSAIKKINMNAVLLVSIHPKLNPAKYQDQQTAQAREMLARWKIWQEFLTTQGFAEFVDKWQNKTRLLYCIQGGKKLFTLGCGESAADFPDDILPSDLMLGTWQNGILFNSLYGTPSLNLCPKIVQEVHQKEQGTSLPMAVSLGLLPKLTEEDQIKKAIADAITNPAKFTINKDIKAVIPYAGKESIERIVNYVIYVIDLY